jgi:acetyl esterase/lipase
VGQAFASKGFITVVADYRLFPEVYFPGFVEDGAKAFAWVHAHIGEYGGNPDNLFLGGHSAGGYIAMMLTLNSQYLEKAGARLAWVKGTIGIAGPYDFLPFTDADIKAIFSKAPEHDTQPINFVKLGIPPILIATGDADTDVKPKNTINLARKLRTDSNPVIERVYPGVAHIGIVLSLANGFRSKTPLLDEIESFIREKPPQSVKGN